MLEGERKMKRKLAVTIVGMLCMVLLSVTVVLSNTYLFYDDFSRGDTQWQVIDGIWTVENGVYKGMPTSPPGSWGPEGKSIAGSDEWSDYIYEGRFMLGAGSFEATLLFRIQNVTPRMDADYLYQIGNHIDGRVVLYRLYGTGYGAEHVVTISYGFQADTWYDFRIVLLGTHIDYLINGAPVFSYNGLMYSKGKIGVKVAWSGPSYFDDLKVLSTVPSPPIPVGGEATPIVMTVNKLSLLAPYIGLTILLAAVVITVGYVKKRKRHIEINS
jgi:hypothetical protein